MVRIAVLDLSYWPPEYMSGQPRFGEVLAAWLARGLPEAELPVIDLVEGDPMPAVGDFDGYVISGSDKGVYDDAPWMQPLRRFLLEARDAGKPLLGICFGHQIMADVFGGKAEKVGDPVIGVRSFSLGGKTVEAHVWHQDQVTRMPPGARIIAETAYCPIAGLEYGFPALSVQFHPEYQEDYLSSFLDRGRGDLFSNEKTDAVLAEIAAHDVDPALFANQAAEFFRKALGMPTPA